ncbi:DUF3826 domain-containing protein [Fodinibius salsisoli]|uniref:DUF3826 domain-containing protein n=1 Tax=Fodinibius salsisoli TaxID=2820877 RepID=A0ABT3PH86_9BACT|nr:DUF3826 domain-containing protein [Fodinibius salsisoli]MCW9705281.1 DUF3826 domain-containing protein [Fodinibius salsisoli]
MMKHEHKFYSLLIVLLVLMAYPVMAQELETIVPEKTFPKEYVKVTEERAAGIVKEMDLTKDKKQQVIQIVAQQYRDLSAIQDTRDAQIKMIEDKFANQATIEQLSREIRLKAERQTNALHNQFFAKLTAEISAEQVNEVKDGMTYNVVERTYNAYLEQLPDLEAKQEAKIKAWLIEAREYAMDAGSSDQKHHIFNDYKGKINNYLSAEGYTLD